MRCLLFMILMMMMIGKNQKSFSIFGNSKEIRVSVFHLKSFGEDDSDKDDNDSR